tara:strand:- start:859 stop:999 length:141 start_codon:yes stop_codon:yes gene_type:complete
MGNIFSKIKFCCLSCCCQKEKQRKEIETIYEKIKPSANIYEQVISV